MQQQIFAGSTKLFCPTIKKQVMVIKMSIEDIIFDKLKKSSIITAKAKPKGGNMMPENSDTADLSIDAYLTEIDQRIKTMEATRENYAYRHIYSCRKFIGGAIVFFKRCVRKLLKWYIEPICFQQTEFNNAVLPSIGRLAELVRLLSQNDEKYERQLEETKNKFNSDFVTAEIVQRLIDDKSDALRQSMEDINGTIESMLSITSNRLSKLEADMTCMRDLNPSIFEKSERSFFEKITNAQSGEDSIMAYILMVLGYKAEEITYLDLGANHARELSNTYYFYEKGAKGVLVEANPELIPELKLMRSRDLVLNYCVSANTDDEIDFYILNGDGLSSADYSSVEEALRVNQVLKIEKTTKVKCITIKRILEDYVKVPPTILNVDIEGTEMEVLRSYDFERFRPTLICIEMIPYEAKLSYGKKNNEILQFLTQKGYTEYAFTGINSVFVDLGVLSGNLEEM